MKIPLATTLAGLAVVSLAACVSPGLDTAQAQTKPAGRQCFWTRNVNNFAALDNRTVYIREGVKGVYELQLLGVCPDVDWTQKLAIVSRGGSQVCTGLDADLVVPSPIGPQRCAVRTVRKLTPEEVAALPPKAKP